MPARDLFHDAVKKGLQKEGWIITHDPLPVHVGGVDMAIDLGAERLIAAEKDGQKIAVEVKSFAAPSAISEFHTALGQFIDYRLALKEQEPSRILYLAIPVDTYDTFFVLPFILNVILDQQMKLIVYAPNSEVIVQWIK